MTWGRYNWIGRKIGILTKQGMRMRIPKCIECKKVMLIETYRRKAYGGHGLCAKCEQILNSQGEL